MAIPWYEWCPIRSRLLSYARAVQGISPYRVTLEPDKSKCRGGYTNFSHRLITVNPTMFEVPPEEQYNLTKAVLCHEAGHRRFTTPSDHPAHVHFVSNILEDDRIERLMEEEFAGIRPLLRKLSEQMLKGATPLSPENDDPVQVLNYILQLRWATRCGQMVNGALSQRNWQRWELVEPLVYEAWTAESSQVCDRNAQEIIHILEIEEHDIPQWLRDLLEKLEAIEGQRRPGDPAEMAAPQAERPLEEDAISGLPFDGEPVPHEHSAGLGDHIIEPQPYLYMVEKVQPLTRKLLEELETEIDLPPLELSERGGRWFFRQYLRDRSRPFVLPQEEHRNPPTLTFRVVIDHSSSMNLCDPFPRNRR
jgi:hypothetical protein